MKIDQSTVTKLVISDLMNSEFRLDPVTVYAEDLGENRGKIIIECYSQSWSAYWGNMGCTSVTHFFMGCSPDYIINCFVPGIDREVYDSNQAEDRLKEIIIKRRQLHDNWRDARRNDWDYDSGFTKREARQLWKKVESTSFSDDPAMHHDLITEVTGHEEWWIHIPTSPNHQYNYLQRIVGAVQQAFSQLNQTKEAS